MPLCHTGSCCHAHPHDFGSNKHMWCLSNENLSAARHPATSRANSDEVPKRGSRKEWGRKTGWIRNLQATKSRKVTGQPVQSRMQKWREPESRVWSQVGKVYLGDFWEKRPIQKHTSGLGSQTSSSREDEVEGFFGTTFFGETTRSKTKLDDMCNILRSSLKQTYPLKMDGWKMKFFLGCPIFRCYVNYRGRRYLYVGNGWFS